MLRSSVYSGLVTQRAARCVPLRTLKGTWRQHRGIPRFNPEPGHIKTDWHKFHDSQDTLLRKAGLDYLRGWGYGRVRNAWIYSMLNYSMNFILIVTGYITAWWRRCSAPLRSSTPTCCVEVSCSIREHWMKVNCFYQMRRLS